MGQNFESYKAPRTGSEEMKIRVTPEKKNVLTFWDTKVQLI